RDLVPHCLALAAQRNPRTGLAAHAHGAGGAIGIAISDVVGHDVRGLRCRGHRMTLALGARDHLVLRMALLDRATCERTAHRAADRRQLLAGATTDLVADQAAEDCAGNGAADVARIATRRLLLHHDIVAFLVRRRD